MPRSRIAGNHPGEWMVGYCERPSPDVEAAADPARCPEPDRIAHHCRQTPRTPFPPPSPPIHDPYRQPEAEGCNRDIHACEYSTFGTGIETPVSDDLGTASFFRNTNPF